MLKKPTENEGISGGLGSMALANSLNLSSSQLSSNFSTHSAQTRDDTLVNFITFNQDSSCVAVGLNNGYKIFNCKNSHSSTENNYKPPSGSLLGRCFQQRKEESVGIIEMLYCTSLLAIVGQGEEPGSSPRKLRIINTKRNSTICDLTFPTTILRVKLTKTRMIVLLEEQIYIYDISTMKLLHTIETSPNVNGLLTLSLEDCDEQGNCYLAYPSPPKTITHDSLLATGINTNGGSNSIHNNIQSVSNTPNRVGDAIIFNVSTLQPLSVIEAHKSTLAAISLSQDGTLLATASDKGTIIRVFSVETGVKLFQFRRGTYPTKIYSLSINQDNQYVVATSSSETVHIFRLGEDEALLTKQKKNGNKKIKLNNSKHATTSTIKEEDEEQIQQQKRQDIRKQKAQQARLAIKKLQIPRKSTSTTATSTTNAGTSFDENDEDIVDIDITDDGDDSDDLVEEEDDEEEDDDDEIDDVDEEDEDEDEEDEDDVAKFVPSRQRKLSGGSTNSFTSVNSVVSGEELLHVPKNIGSNNPPGSPKNEPIVDLTRISMARLIRRSSQTLGRKAAQKMGDFLPSRFSSILEPTRHFASLKINTIGKDVKSIAVMSNEAQEDIVPRAYLTSREAIAAATTGTIPPVLTNNVGGSTSSTPSKESFLESKETLSLNLIHIQVVTSEGIFYTYGLDPERGGDCILLHQYSLLNEG